MHMRRGEWAEAAKVIGIECVGLVKSCPGGEFPIGAKVAALMGGLGRTINGSYAEYTRVRASNVALIESDLPWAELAAIPETYAIAWTCLFRNLEIARGQTLVIRGAASAFGQAALNMAVDASVRVIATTRGRERVALLEQLGAERVETEGPELSQRIAEAKQLDAVLDLVGNSTILDSLAMLRRGWSRVPRGLVGRPGADQGLQPALANGERRLPDLLWQLRVRRARLPAVRRAAPGNRAESSVGQAQGEAITRVSLRGDPRGASRHGGQ
jgi:NADPH:quinone reductase